MKECKGPCLGKLYRCPVYIKRKCGNQDPAISSARRGAPTVTAAPPQNPSANHKHIKVFLSLYIHRGYIAYAYSSFVSPYCDCVCCGDQYNAVLHREERRVTISRRKNRRLQIVHEIDSHIKTTARNLRFKNLGVPPGLCIC